MKKRIKIIGIVITGIVLANAIGIMFFANITNSSDYIMNIQIPGIVEGSAKMIDTNSFFAKNKLETASVEIDLECNNTENVRLTIGYKSSNEKLFDATNSIKETTIWLGNDIYPSKSQNLVDISQVQVSQNKQIKRRWDLFGVDFSSKDYVKADERIWFLKIQDITDGPYGYVTNVTETINGTTITRTEYISNIYRLNSFELCFGNLKFKTLLYPTFDGSCDVVIPIRGVTHELISDENESTISKKNYSTITTTDGRPNEHWAIVFATGVFADPDIDPLTQCPIAGHLFIMGQDPNPPSGIPSSPNGIFDFGWSIIYCISGVENPSVDVPTKTCQNTDDSFLQSMFNQADTLCGSSDELIVFVTSHGCLEWFTHSTVTSSGDTFRCSEYKSCVTDITSDGTYVFLWIAACRGNGLGTWYSGQHNSHLEVWYYKPYHVGMAFYSGVEIYYFWTFAPNWGYDSEGHILFDYLNDQYYLYHITAIFPYIEEEYEDYTSYGMYKATYWGNYHFFISL